MVESSAAQQRHLRQVQSLYDRWSEVFLRCAGPTHQTVLLPVGLGPRETNLEMARRLGVVDAMVLLDAGCGVGGPAIDLASEFKRLRVEGLTISPAQVALAATEIAAAGLSERVRVQQGDYHTLPFGDATFDAAWLLESSCYSPSPPRLLAELFRVLRPGAQVYLKDLFADPQAKGPQAQRDRLKLRRLWALPRLWPLATWAGWATRQGFEVVRALPLQDATNHWYTGAMFELGPKGFGLNEFGQHFAVGLPAAPIVWAELLLRRPG